MRPRNAAVDVSFRPYGSMLPSIRHFENAPLSRLPEMLAAAADASPEMRRRLKSNTWPRLRKWLEDRGHTVEMVRRPKGPAEVIYGVSAVDSGNIKIGIARHLPSRFSGLQTGSSLPLVVVAAISTMRFDPRTTERQIHEHLGAHRKHGEWFADVPEVREFLRRAVDAAGGIWVLS